MVHALQEAGCPIDRRFIEAPIVYNSDLGVRILHGCARHLEVGLVCCGCARDAHVVCSLQFFEKTGAVANMPAALMTLLITALLVYGIRESTRINNIVVVIKLVVIVLFIVVTGSKVCIDLIST